MIDNTDQEEHPKQIFYLLPQRATCFPGCSSSNRTGFPLPRAGVRGGVGRHSSRPNNLKLLFGTIRSRST